MLYMSYPKDHISKVPLPTQTRIMSFPNIEIHLDALHVISKGSHIKGPISHLSQNYVCNDKMLSSNTITLESFSKRKIRYTLHKQTRAQLRKHHMFELRLIKQSSIIKMRHRIGHRDGWLDRFNFPPFYLYLKFVSILELVTLFILF